MKTFFDKTINITINLERKLGKYAPYLYILLSSFFYTSMGFCIKLAKTVPPMQLIYTRTFVNSLCCFCFASYENCQLSPKNIATSNLLIRRGLLGAVTVVLFVYSLYFLPLSLVQTIMRMTPLFVGIMGSIFYKEAYKLSHFISTIICFIGIFMIFKPFSGSDDETTNNENSKSHDYAIGIFLILLYVLGDSLVCLTIRELRNKTSVIVVVFYFNFFSLIFSGLGCFLQPPQILSFYEWEILGWVSFFAFGGHLLSSRALFLEKAFMITVLSYISIFFGYIYDVFILDEKIDGWTYLGMIVIIAPMIFLVVFEKDG